MAESPLKKMKNEQFAQIMVKLSNQRQLPSNNFCDVTLVAQGREFKAHRSVLAAASPYFEMMFTSDMKEKQQELVQLRELSASVVKPIIDFIYTGDVQIDDANVEDLLASADYLLLGNLKAQAVEFLVQNLSISNCISTYYKYLSEKYECHDLLRNVTEFINRNFISVSESENFLALNSNQVKKWISSDHIIIDAEEDVFDVVLKWIANDKSGTRENYFEELFQNIRLTSVAHHYLFTDIINNRLVRRNTQCLDLVHNALKQIIHETTPRQKPRKCLKKHVETIVLCGGKSAICYVPSKRCWYKLEPMKEKRVHHGLSSCRGFLYVVGERFGYGLGTAERYDPLINHWSPIESSQKDLRHTAVVTLQGYVYLVGGVSMRGDDRCMILYDPESNSWKQVASLISPRHSVCAVADDDYIYAIGGRTIDYCPADMVERYHPRTNAWVSLSPMTKQRSAACGLVLEGKIFVFGGLTNGPPPAGNSTLSGACEMYCCATDQWQVISSMQFPRYHGSAVAFGGAIYVVGGWSAPRKREDSVELYNPRNDKWEREATMPVTILQETEPFKACALRISKTVLHRLAPLKTT